MLSALLFLGAIARVFGVDDVLEGVGLHASQTLATSMETSSRIATAGMQYLADSTSMSLIYASNKFLEAVTIAVASLDRFGVIILLIGVVLITLSAWFNRSDRVDELL